MKNKLFLSGKSRDMLAAFVLAPALIAGAFGAQPAVAAAPADINPNATGSIIVHKHEEPAAGNRGGAGNGTAQNPGTDPISGVTFTVQQISGVDLKTAAGWQALQTLTPAQAANRLTGEVKTQTTIADGSASFTNLKVGAYLVKETNAPANVLTRAADFIVTIPHPTADNGRWVYDVNVYPKNSVSTAPTKTLNDANAKKAGDNVVWTITQTMPQLPANKTFTAVEFTDTLAANLQYVSAVVKINDSITAGADVNVSNVNQQVTVRVSGNAAALLAAGDRVVVELTTAVNGPGEIKNTANTKITTSDGDEVTGGTPPVDNPQAPTTTWGYFDVNKTAAGGSTGLKGAVFELYTGNDCGVSGGDKVNFNTSQLTTGDNGKLPAALLVKAGTYSLKEVKAPVGYVVGSNSCTQLTVDATGTLADPKIANISNEKAAVPGLPLTGSQGQAILVIAGSLLMLAGLFAVFAMRKRNNKKSEVV